MRQVKIFKSIESEITTLEEEINSWIQEQAADIVSVTGNLAPQTGGGHGRGFSASDILVVIVYEPKK
jgi:hypothetical protein